MSLAHQALAAAATDAANPQSLNTFQLCKELDKKPAPHVPHPLASLLDESPGHTPPTQHSPKASTSPAPDHDDDEPQPSSFQASAAFAAAAAAAASFPETPPRSQTPLDLRHLQQEEDQTESDFSSFAIDPFGSYTHTDSSQRRHTERKEPLYPSDDTDLP